MNLFYSFEGTKSYVFWFQSVDVLSTVATLLWVRFREWVRFEKLFSNCDSNHESNWRRTEWRQTDELFRSTMQFCHERQSIPIDANDWHYHCVSTSREREREREKERTISTDCHWYRTQSHILYVVIIFFVRPLFSNDMSPISQHLMRSNRIRTECEERIDFSLELRIDRTTLHAMRTSSIEYLFHYSTQR